MQAMRAFVDEHRHTHGVEPRCQALEIAPSGYRRQVRQQANPSLRRAGARRDADLMPQIQRAWDTNLRVYGADKVWPRF